MKLRQLFEAPRKVAVAAFGRMNPPTIGHEKLVEKIKSFDGDHYLFLSQTQKPKDNPLPFDVKLQFSKQFFPSVNVGHPTVRTPIQMLQMLEKLGYTDIIYVAGSDRVESFTKLFNDYNGKEYNFDSIEVVSAGERDPDADGAEGMSASKMRAAAASGDYEAFAQGVPTPALAQKLYDAVRKGMGVKDTAPTEGVAEGQLNEASARDVILSLLDKFYADMKLPPRQGGHNGELDIESPGTQVWTRGDGTRYRKPGRIKATYFPDDKKQAAKAAADFWPWLLKQPGVKSIGQVSGEFGSDPMKDAVSYKGLYFSGRPGGVEFGSLSRYKNPRSVWRQKKDEQGVAEDKKHISPSGVETDMDPSDDDYAINYGKDGSVAKFRKSQGLDVKTGNKKTKEAAYKGNLGLMELFAFFSKAEKTDPELVAKVKSLIKQGQDKQVWNIVQNYTGTKLMGKEFEGSIAEAIIERACKSKSKRKSRG